MRSPKPRKGTDRKLSVLHLRLLQARLIVRAGILTTLVTIKNTPEDCRLKSAVLWRMRR
jgi:hypothetical protein